MALEISVAAPIALYVLGWDAVATDILYLSLTLSTLSQIPKRFLWRYRPFMVHRAQQRKKTTTSSFPSRAVACATVYACILPLAIFAAVDSVAYKRFLDSVLLNFRYSGERNQLCNGGRIHRQVVAYLPLSRSRFGDIICQSKPRRSLSDRLHRWNNSRCRRLPGCGWIARCRFSRMRRLYRRWMLFLSN